MNHDWLEKYPKLSKILLDYGWFVAPYILGGDFKRIESLCDYIISNPPSNEDDKKIIEAKIDAALSDVVFHPQFRAFFVFRSISLSYVKEYSHIYESAIHAYYKRDYISAIFTLLPLIEGVLLNYYGWRFGNKEKKPTIKQLINHIRTIDLTNMPPPMRDRSIMFRDILADFLERWIYINTDKANFSLSFLNRHFALHSIGAKPFYRPSDVHRLLLLFDLIIEFLSIQKGSRFNFIPENEPSLNFRRVFYDQLAKGEISIKQTTDFSRVLLSQHINYEQPDIEPTWENSQLNSILEIFEIISKLQKFDNSPSNQPSE